MLRLAQLLKLLQPFPFYGYRTGLQGVFRSFCSHCLCLLLQHLIAYCTISSIEVSVVLLASIRSSRYAAICQLQLAMTWLS